MNSLLPTLLLSVLAVAPLAAQPGAKWIEIRTPHFTVLSNSNEKDARRVASQFEHMRSFFHVVIPTASDDPATPIVVFALKDNKSFRTLEPEAYLAKNQLQLAGYFLRAEDRNYILLRLDTEDEHRFSTIYHEYTHYIMRKSDAWIPLWLSEGLAEFYQNTDLQEKDVRLGQPSQDDILYLRQNRLLPLATLLTVDHTSPYYHDEQKGSVFYAEAWALTHFLEVTDFDNNTHRMQDYSRRMQQHEDSLAAAEHAFGDLGKLQKALDAYVAGMQFKEFRLKAPLDLSDASFQVRSLPSTEADAWRADVLVDVQRHKDAQTLLESVLQADPNSALAHEAMGTLRFSEHDVPGARKWFGEAVQLDSKSYLANYYFGAMSLQEGDTGHDEAIEKSLRAAIALNPAFAPSYDALANLFARRHTRLDEAVTLTRTAVQLEPETIQYRLNAAQVLAQNQQMENAIRVLKAAEPLARTPEQKESVARQIAQMQQFAALQEQSRHPAQPSAGGEVRTFQVVDAHPVIETVATEAPAFSPPASNAPHHTVSGVLRGVACSYPTILTLTLERAAGPLKLYTSNYYKVPFRTLNDTSSDELLPCKDIDGMKAKIEYTEVEDKRVAGEILYIDLSR